MQATKSSSLKNIDLFLPFGLLGTILLLILPISCHFLDILLAFSIGSSLLILLIVIYLKEPAEFSIFPSLLLAVTLYRLGLNVASTRLILLDGYAGNVIGSFGNFVVRGNYVVGMVIFLILVVINFIVITKGAGRIAEVAARFTLDAMPGKQMAIDAELNAGLIDETMATRRRQKVQKEADFYGAMDGASKFVRGDAIASILITFINIVGGIAIGILQKHMPLIEALQKYTLLSIGDGLVSQIPALIVSVGCGILITRTSEDINLGEHFGQQLMVYPRAVGLSSVMMGIFAILPGLPFFPFALLSGFLGAAAHFLHQHAAKNPPTATSSPTKTSAGSASTSATPEAENLSNLTLVEPFVIELGYNLLSFADPQSSDNLLARVTNVRKKFATDWGLILPIFTIKDQIDLKENQYRFLLQNRELARGTLMPKHWMAINSSKNCAPLEGTAVKEPVFGLDAFWILDNVKPEAELHGYTLIDASSVLITHLTECLKNALHLLLSREDTQKLVNTIKEKNPTLVNELLPDLVNIGLIQRVLQNLLREKIAIKNLTLILETIADYAPLTKNPDEISEQVRRRLGIYFIPEFENPPGTIQALTLDPSLEQTLISGIRKNAFELGLLIAPELTQKLLHELQTHLETLTHENLDSILVLSGELRLPFKRFFEPNFPHLKVIAYQEIPNSIRLHNKGMITITMLTDNSTNTQ